MKVLYPLLWLTLVFLVSSSIFAQQTHLHRQYHTQTYMEERQALDATIESRRQQLQRAINQFRLPINDEVIIIPIVFHVLFSSEEERLSADRIQSQLEALNADFAGLDSDEEHSNDPYQLYQKRAADTHIQFCYPLLNPLNLLTTGVNYIPVSPNLTDNLEQIKQAESGLAAWDASRYLNV